MKTSRFEFHRTRMEALLIVQREPIVDQRGSFCRFYCCEEFRAAGLQKAVAQINHTTTLKKGVVRGLHFQYPPHAEVKLVSCIQGEIFDVAVDLRKGSPTFLHWHGEILSARNNKSMLIPEGFAHGFQALTTRCQLLYLHSTPFCSEAEGALNATDPRIAIEWPLAITELSGRDRSHPLIDSDFEGITL